MCSYKTLVLKCIAAVAEPGERWFEAEAPRLETRVVWFAGDASFETIERLLERAMALTDELDPRPWKPRAATLRARLWRDRIKAEGARQFLAPNLA